MITLTREEAQQIEQYIKPGALVPVDMQTTQLLVNALRARLAQPELEPDKYLMEVECTKCGAKQDGILTVNAPPQREWQGLTEHEKALVMRRSINRRDAVTLTETMLREKNV
jgi:hypothetical protein